MINLLAGTVDSSDFIRRISRAKLDIANVFGGQSETAAFSKDKGIKPFTPVVAAKKILDYMREETLPVLAVQDPLFATSNLQTGECGLQAINAANAALAKGDLPRLSTVSRCRSGTRNVLGKVCDAAFVAHASVADNAFSNVFSSKRPIEPCLKPSSCAAFWDNLDKWAIEFGTLSVRVTVAELAIAFGEGAKDGAKAAARVAGEAVGVAANAAGEIAGEALIGVLKGIAIPGAIVIGGYVFLHGRGIV